MNDNDGANMKDDSKHEDDFCQRMIGPLKDNSAPPNQDLMAAAIAAATETFAAGEDSDDSTRVIQTKESRTMFSFVRPLAAIVATTAAVLIVAMLSRGANANVTLGDVLDRLKASKNLKLLIKQAGDEAEVLVAGDSVRWQDSESCYTCFCSSRRLVPLNQTLLSPLPTYLFVAMRTRRPMSYTRSLAGSPALIRRLNHHWRNFDW